MTPHPLRIAFIGAGQMARQHLRAVSRAKTPAVVVGVHDRETGAAAAFASAAGAPAFASIDTLMAEARPDVVHVCTPPQTHVASARAALEAGAHVYVEKPFALTAADAGGLLDLAAARGALVCAGHQLLRDPGFERLMARVPRLGELVQVDSHFAFKPAAARAAREPRAAADQLIDILPHPLYSLVAVLEHAAPGEPIEIAAFHAGPADLQATLRAGDRIGRLSVSLRARPIASTLTVIGTGGSITCDFVRSIIVGAGNAGTEPLEKIANPFVEGLQLLGRTAKGLPHRLRGGYPGLAELIDAFYASIAAGAPSPISPAHLLRVSALLETFVAGIEGAAAAATVAVPQRAVTASRPLTVVTGASGFLGSRIVAALESVRGVSRTASPDRGVPWVIADLAKPLPADAFAGADVVVHAAAATSGGFDAHERNSVEASRHVLRAMQSAGVSRLVLVSSLSVVRPPRSPWERQDESTPRARDPRPLGAYTWGKTVQEEVVEREAAELGIALRIVRPGALIDANDPSFPGLMGRRLFGRWHLGLGRPSLPIAVCDVDRSARAIAWCATHFDNAPEIVNLFDPAIATRRAMVRWARAHGWDGRVVWVPISVLAFSMTAARTALALLAERRLPAPLATWSILRPRRFDARVSAALLAAVDRETGTAPDDPEPAAAAAPSPMAPVMSAGEPA